MAKTACAEARIVKGKIVIEVPVNFLPKVLEASWACRVLTTRYRVESAEQFAKELVNELNREREDGTTPIHMMFDRAIERAIEAGGFGLEEHPEQDA
jgi:hypothetical protein